MYTPTPTRVLLTLAALLSSTLVTATLPPAHAQTPEQFYKGRQVTLLIGAGAGGGYDTYARLLAPHLARNIPGTPTIIPRIKEGAGSIVAMNFAVNALPHDGSVIVAVERTVALVQLMGGKGILYKAAELQWIGSLANEFGVCAVSRKSGITRFSDLFEKSVTVGGFGRNDSEMIPAVINNTIGTRFRVIAGYPSSAPAHLAVQRGEIDGLCQSWATIQELSRSSVSDGSFFPIVQMSLKPHPALDQNKVPMIFDFITKDRVQPGLTTDEVRSLLEVWFATKMMGRPYVMAPRVPADRVAAIRKAFVATTTDERFKADAARQRREIELVTGEEIQDIVTRMAKAPPALLAKMEDLQKYRGPVETAKVNWLVHTGKVTELKDNGREVVILYEGKPVSAKISGSRTALSLAG